MGRARGEVQSADGPGTPALRELAFAVDRSVEVDAKGLPVCGFRLLATPDRNEARRRCRGATIGAGEAVVEFAYPENSPIPVEAPLVVFNGGVSRGVTTLFVWGATPIPVPKAMVAKVEVWKREDGRYGWTGRRASGRAFCPRGVLLTASASSRFAQRCNDDPMDPWSRSGEVPRDSLTR